MLRKEGRDAMIQRFTPNGFIVSEHPTGLFLEGPLDRALEMAKNERDIVLSFKRTIPARHMVELRDNPEDPTSVAEWGSSTRSREEAMRYALGAFLGSYEDPIIPTAEKRGRHERGNA